MRARRLRITPDLWIEALKNERPLAFRVIKNALPADARCVRMEQVTTEHGAPNYVVLWIESAAFLDSDPDDYLDPILTTVDPTQCP